MEAADEADIPLDCLLTWSAFQGVKLIFVNTVPVFCHLQVFCMGQDQVTWEFHDGTMRGKASIAGKHPSSGSFEEVNSDLASISSALAESRVLYLTGSVLLLQN